MNVESIPNANTNHQEANSAADALMDAGQSPSAIVAEKLAEIETDDKGNILMSAVALKALIAETVALSNQTALGQVRSAQQEAAAAKFQLITSQWFGTTIGGFAGTRPTEDDVILDLPKDPTQRGTMHVPVTLNLSTKKAGEYCVSVFTRGENQPQRAPTGTTIVQSAGASAKTIDVSGRILFCRRYNLLIGETLINQSLQFIPLIDSHGKVVHRPFTVRCQVQLAVRNERIKLARPYINDRNQLVWYEDRPIALAPDEIESAIERQDAREKGPGDSTDANLDGDPNPNPDSRTSLLKGGL